jgi:hypothetical protein
MLGKKTLLTRSRHPFQAQLDPEVRDLCVGVHGTIYTVEPNR